MELNDVIQHPYLRTDSYGKIFLYCTPNDCACVPRHTIQMSEPVRPDVLQQAVKAALLRFPHMMIGIEATDTQLRYRINVADPVVLPFDGLWKRYCIGTEDTNGFLFLVGYQDDKIYMEYQHSTSDGRGFEEFIRCVLFNYLKLCGKPVENDGTVRGLDSVYTIKESEDAYSHLADSYSGEGIYQKPAALHAEELTDVGDQPEVITEVTFPFEQLHKAAKSMGASPLSVIAPLFSRAFRQKFGKDSDAPVISQIPADLRPYVPSATTRYFICFLDLPYEASYDDLPLEEVCRRTKAFLKDQMLPERLLFRAKRASDVCRELHERDIPLAEKEAEAANLSKNFVLEDSFLITNVGEFRLPESMKPYVLDYGAVLPCASQPCAMLISSYNGNMKISIAQRGHDLDLPTMFSNYLASLGVHTRLYSYPFRVTWYDGMTASKAYRL